MSREGRDSTYKPKSKTARGLTWESSRVRSRDQVDYAEVEGITSDTASEGTIENIESGFGSIKQEQNFAELDLDCERFEDTWTPGTLRHKATQVTNQLARLTEVNTELVMAKEAEKSSVEKLMELMLTMMRRDMKGGKRRGN